MNNTRRNPSPVKKSMLAVILCLVFMSPMFSMANVGLNLSDATQDTDSLAVNVLTSEEEFELSAIKLPPLRVIIDSAVALSPERRYALLIAEEERINFRMAKINLLQMISLRASYNYGQIAGNYIQESEIYQPITSFSKSNQDYVNAGVYLSVPIGDLVNLRQKKKIMQLRVQRQQEDGERVAREVTVTVINEYRKLQIALINLKAKSDKLNINKTQYQMALNKFEKGVLDIHALSSVSALYSDARVDYDNTLGEVKTCMLLLETHSGVRLID